MKHKPKISFEGEKAPLLAKEGLGVVKTPLLQWRMGWGLRSLLYALLLSLASCKSCKKEEPSPESKLPPATQTGANTFGCLIDGQPWIPNGTGGFMGSPAINGGYLGGGNGRRVELSLYKRDGLNLQLYLERVDKAGRYELNFDTETYPNLVYPRSYGYYSIRNATPATSSSYVTTSQVTGYVNFTVADTISKKVAGTFEFDAIDRNSGKIIKITQGRFDIDPATLNK